MRHPLDAQSQRAAKHRGTLLVFGGHHERGIRFARQAGEPNGDLSGEWRGTVENDERERAAAQEDVRAPGAGGGRFRAHHPDAACHQVLVGPITRGERSPRIHVRHPQAVPGGLLDECAKEGGLPTPPCSQELGEPAAWQAMPGQHRIERVDTGGQPWSLRRVGTQHLRELFLECGERGGHGGVCVGSSAAGPYRRGRASTE